MKKQIKITCIGAALVDIFNLIPFQGELKELSEKAYQQYKKSILKFGLSEPFSVWETDNGILFILNGHQKLKTLTRMVVEGGYSVGRVPVSFVDCKNEKEAKEKVLALTAAFGEMSQTSLIEFCQDAEIDFDTALSDYRFADIDLTVDPDAVGGDNGEGSGEGQKKTTIKLKCLKEDRDEVIKKINDALVDFDGVDVL